MPSNAGMSHGSITLVVLADGQIEDALLQQTKYPHLHRICTLAKGHTSCWIAVLGRIRPDLGRLMRLRQDEIGNGLVVGT